ncbi:MAG: hypothetical protein GWN84_09580 [Gammaproteobacteria bacterium]|nr:hypothetical protein [Gammaproteobacteria bacterium]NIR83122.1 hypothetical protein [Gammaproteobacteria bacterium]NIR90784.1 hypothetical protein [Gammaproteobacteria bacterium]NIU04275.1 hypothetical protein [Gammaproteobacteria bacterium]NIV51567.1 hypothetical protein [Gammaproteobacteria bacterium]
MTVAELADVVAPGSERRCFQAEPMLVGWHLFDPPDATERWRNYVIEPLQGTRNPLID